MTSEPEKMKARWAVREAVKRKTLIKPASCQQCGMTPAPAKDGRSTLHAHHHLGYDKPLEVTWLCLKCHFGHDLRPAGQDNGRARLSASQVASIRSRYRPNAKWWAPEGSAKALAREFGISDRTVRRIVMGEIWIDAALAAPPVGG